MRSIMRLGAPSLSPYTRVKERCRVALCDEWLFFFFFQIGLEPFFRESFGDFFFFLFSRTCSYCGIFGKSLCKAKYCNDATLKLKKKLVWASRDLTRTYRIRFTSLRFHFHEMCCIHKNDVSLLYGTTFTSDIRSGNQLWGYVWSVIF